jgi:hypothetical protein
MNYASSRDVGEVIFNWTAPGPISSCWGSCDDGEDLWISDPTVSGTNIFQVTYDGSYTGFMITVNQGQGWIADMVSDGEWLYCCLVGGPNSIAKIDLATGTTVSTITGDWAGVPPQGLAWHPIGGPDQEGSLWVVKYSEEDYVFELDPNNGWANLQFFSFPNGQQYSGAGAEICLSGNYSGTLWLSNQSDNNIYLIDVQEPFLCCPPGTLSENLLGYNIYRNDIFVAYAAHWPEGEWLPQYFIDLDLEPGIYDYAVSAVYDLEIYGYPDEADESFLEGPAEVEVNYCFDLEFTETWQVGNFDANSWNVGGDNWIVSGQQGSPPGCVEFSWAPVKVDYEIALESYSLCADEMTEGTIWLDFDLKLDAVQPTGEEILEVQVWGWENQQWHSVAGYSNGNGSFEWKNEHLDIRAHAMNQIFKVRFLAKGNSSSDIIGWYIDNIHIYRTCAGPVGLEATAASGSEPGILLNWFGPDYNLIDEWILSGELSALSRELIGYNIWRSIDGGEYELIDFTSGPTYLDSESCPAIGSLYCYKVSAVWESETDQCESALSEEECIIWTGIGDGNISDASSISLYPNPADDHVSISTSGTLKRVTIYNTLGQLVSDDITADRQYELETTSYTIGIYMVRVETAEGVTTRTLTVQR